jgi:hypothetical protein
MILCFLNVGLNPIKLKIYIELLRCTRGTYFIATFATEVSTFVATFFVADASVSGTVPVPVPVPVPGIPLYFRAGTHCFRPPLQVRMCTSAHVRTKYLQTHTLLFISQTDLLTDSKTQT